MIDSLLYHLNRRKYLLIDPNYKPENAVLGRDIIKPHRERLVVLFPPWHGDGRVYRRLVQRLSKKGWGVVAYHFNKQILEAEDHIVVESYRQIQKQVVEDLELIVKDSHKEVRFIGLSLGNLALVLVAD